MKVGINEKQAHAILDISARVKDPKHSAAAENKPLILPNDQSDNDVPTY